MMVIALVTILNSTAQEHLWMGAAPSLETQAQRSGSVRLKLNLVMRLGPGKTLRFLCPWDEGWIVQFLQEKEFARDLPELGDAAVPSEGQEWLSNVSNNPCIWPCRISSVSPSALPLPVMPSLSLMPKQCWNKTQHGAIVVGLSGSAESLSLPVSQQPFSSRLLRQFSHFLQQSRNPRG